jgi:RNA polymerase sigma-70 factor, ECF subfamily
MVQKQCSRIEPKERFAPRKITPARFTPKSTPRHPSVTLESEICDQLLATVPHLRAFAMSRCRKIDCADDLVQETLLRALDNIDSFEPGSNMQAWLFTIERNLFYSEYRRSQREVPDDDGRYAERLRSAPDQVAQVKFAELRTALAKLPDGQREALTLVGAAGFSYGDAATICGCAVGTIKSRVNRARARLAELLSIDGIDDFGPDAATRAVLAGGT